MFPIHDGVGAGAQLVSRAGATACMCMYQKWGLQLRYVIWPKSFVLNSCPDAESSEICNVRVLETRHFAEKSDKMIYSCIYHNQVY